MDIEAAMKRIPPHSAEAEQAVLGAMLMNKEAVMVASENYFRRGFLPDCIRNSV